MPAAGSGKRAGCRDAQVTAQRVYRFFPAAVAVATFLVFLPALQNDWVNWDDAGISWKIPRTGDSDGPNSNGCWTTDLLRHYIPLSG